MANKTIYVSQADEPLFEQAKQLAGQALSSVIAKALREFVARNEDKQKGMKEVSLKVGKAGLEQEKRFIGMHIGDWRGFSDNKEWYQTARIYQTQKNNWAVLVITISKASLLTDKKAWRKSGDFLVNAHKSELYVGKTPYELKDKLPGSLYEKLLDLQNHNENPIEYLDI